MSLRALLQGVARWLTRLDRWAPDDLTAVARATGVLVEPTRTPAPAEEGEAEAGAGSIADALTDDLIGAWLTAWQDEPCGHRDGGRVCVAGCRHIAHGMAHVYAPERTDR